MHQLKAAARLDEVDKQTTAIPDMKIPKHRMDCACQPDSPTPQLVCLRCVAMPLPR